MIEPGDPILVTGATGFVGSAVLRALLGRGAKARALARDSARRDNLVGLECEVVGGDIRDPQAMTRALAGARYLFHVAADYRLWSRDPAELRRANVEGTRTVMEAALAAGV